MVKGVCEEILRRSSYYRVVVFAVSAICMAIFAMYPNVSAHLFLFHVFDKNLFETTLVAMRYRSCLGCLN